MNVEADRPAIRRLKPRPETARKREQIIDAAADIFGAKGYSVATLEEIGQVVGLTHAGIRHHFGNKENLLLEAVRRRDITDLYSFADGHMPSGMDQFEHLIETASRNEQRPGIVQAFVVLSAESLTHHSPTRDYFETRYRELRAEISQNLERLCAERGIDDPDGVNHATTCILALMDGVQYQWLLDPDQVELAKTTEYGIRAILANLLGDAS